MSSRNPTHPLQRTAVTGVTYVKEKPDWKLVGQTGGLDGRLGALRTHWVRVIIWGLKGRFTGGGGGLGK